MYFAHCSYRDLEIDSLPVFPQIGDLTHLRDTMTIVVQKFMVSAADKCEKNEMRS